MKAANFFSELRRRNVYKVAIAYAVVASLVPAYLRLDPLWDPLRSDPAFQKLCEEKQP